MIKGIEREIEEVVSLLRKEFELVKVNLLSEGPIESEGVWAIPMSKEYNKIALSESPIDFGKGFIVAILNKPITDGWNILDWGSPVVVENNGPNRAFATKERNLPSFSTTFLMTVKRYKKKPIVIEAVQLLPHTVDCIYDWMDISDKGNFPGCGHGIDPIDGNFKITTPEGIMIAGLGDYIIKGLRGEFYPCKADIFNKSYEEQ